MNWVYLSPHLDDAALSCGGLIWEQARSGDKVSIWTICAGDPPAEELSPFARSLHARWGTGPQSMESRREEDSASCEVLGAGVRHLPVTDCIYRQASTSGFYLYDSEESLNGPLHPDETNLIRSLGQELTTTLPLGAELVCPLAIGEHVDHQLTRAAAQSLGLSLCYYADFPYVQDSYDQLTSLQKDGWRKQTYPVSESAMDAWETSVEAHGSQIGTFWTSSREMRLALRRYRTHMGGVCLWRAPNVDNA